jgi:hypothetical protein
MADEQDGDREELLKRTKRVKLLTADIHAALIAFQNQTEVPTLEIQLALARALRDITMTLFEESNGRIPLGDEVVECSEQLRKWMKFWSTKQGD